MKIEYKPIIFLGRLKKRDYQMLFFMTDSNILAGVSNIVKRERCGS